MSQESIGNYSFVRISKLEGFINSLKQEYDALSRKIEHYNQRLKQFEQKVEELKHE